MKNSKNGSSISDLVRLIKTGQYKTKQLIELTKFSRSYVYKIKKLVKKGVDVKPKKRPGRPTVLCNRDKKVIFGLITKNDALTCQDLSKLLKSREGHKVNKTTIWRYLKARGYFKLIPKKVPMLTTAQKLLRVKWAKEHRKTDWKKVVFTDESMFQFYSNNLRCWGKKRTSISVPKYRPKVHVWGGISMLGTTTFAIKIGKVNSEIYQRILDENLESMYALYGHDFSLQQDNARPHVSRSTKEYFAKRGMNVLNWPANSPDLNPIENIWGIMKARLDKTRKKSITEWTDQLNKLWENLDHDLLRSLVESMPRRLKMVIQSNGEIIKY